MHKKTLVLLCCLSLAACANSDKKEQYYSNNDSCGSFHGNVLNIRSVICNPRASVHNATAASANFM